MAKRLTHDQWMAKQFNNLKTRYRDAVLHASFIEGVVRNNSKRRSPNFRDDIQWLYIHKKITKKEQAALDAVRDARNLLVHGIVPKRASEEQILQWLDNLMNRALEAYHASPFLKAELLTKYGIDPKDLPKPRLAK